MSQPARKPNEPLPDDPSIPVLTERLTLPPLDLDLDFRLPPRPATPAPVDEPAADLGEPPLADDDATRLVARDETARAVPVDVVTGAADPDDATRYAPLAADDPALAELVDDATRYVPPAEDATRIAPQARQAEIERPDADAFEVDAGPDRAAAPSADNPLTAGGLGADTRGPVTGTFAAPAADAEAPGFAESRDKSRDEAPADAAEAPLESSAAPAEDDAGAHVLGYADDATRVAPSLRPAPEADLRGPSTVMPAEPAEDGPRVPSSLLVSNLTSLMSTPAPRHRRPQPDDFDLTATDPGHSLNQLDAELRERILLDLARRLPTEVDTIVRRHLETAIDEAMRRFAAEVRIALAGSLREIVDRAVKAELDRVRQPRR